MWRVLLCALVLAGCGRFGFGSAGDDVVDDDASVVTTDGAVADGLVDAAPLTADAKPCTGTAHLLTDNFDDNMFNAVVWGNSYEDATSRHVEANGRLEIRMAAGSTDDWAGYVSTMTYQLAGDRAFVEVPVVNAQRGNAVFLLWTSLAKTDGPSVEFERGRLLLRRRINDSILDRANIAYDATNHRWWQIRELAGTMYWETSPDGVTWTVRHSEPTPSATTAIVVLAAGSGNGDPADLVVFDNFNGGGAPPACP
ncbi:MAG TPA: hypothetical protein VIV11_42090 [Kofleriaceae bacterium]